MVVGDRPLVGGQWTIGGPASVWPVTGTCGTGVSGAIPPILMVRAGSSQGLGRYLPLVVVATGHFWLVSGVQIELDSSLT